jgi:glycosyltransferase involved in cell wall biosynthesis
MSLVSVIIPVYNGEKFIRAALESVIGQSHQELEVIVVNDGSSDNTQVVVREMMLIDSRISLINQDNAGCSAAKNSGLASAKGAFIQYLDADDILSADKIAEQLTVLEKQRLKVAVCRTKVFSESVNVGSELPELDSGFLYSTDDTLGFLLNLYGINGVDGMIQPNAFLISRDLADIIGPWDVSLSPSRDEDGEYFCRAILNSTGIEFTPVGINYYRKLNGVSSLSKQVSYKHAVGSFRSLVKKTEHLLKREGSQRIRELMSFHFAIFNYQYGVQYKDLYEEVKAYIRLLGVSKPLKVGGKYFRLLSTFIGFDNSIRLRRYIKGF